MLTHFKSSVVQGACCQPVDKGIKLFTLHKDLVNCPDCKQQYEFIDYNEKAQPKEEPTYKDSLSYKLRKHRDPSIVEHTNLVLFKQRGRVPFNCKMCGKKLINKICPNYKGK